MSPRYLLLSIADPSCEKYEEIVSVTDSYDEAVCVADLGAGLFLYGIAILDTESGFVDVYGDIFTMPESEVEFWRENWKRNFT